MESNEQNGSGRSGEREEMETSVILSTLKIKINKYSELIKYAITI